MEPKLLTSDEVAQRVEITVDADPPHLIPVSTPARSLPRFFEPSIDAANSYANYLTSEGSFQTGFKGIDICMPGGLDRGDMFLIIGKTHSGKSTIAYNSVIHNLQRSSDFRAVIFSPDEPRELAIAKLYSIAFQRNSAETEKAIREGDVAHVQEFENACRGLLDRVLICDQSLTFSQMLSAMDEAQSYWNAPANAVVMDYLELLPGDSADANSVAHKAQEAKRFAKVADVPLVLLHQIGRGASKRGTAGGISAGRFGGESEAVAVLECYRQKDREDLSHQDQIRFVDSINLSLCKNKRPPFRLIDIEMVLDPNPGRIREPSVHDMQDRDWEEF